ncbi:MAG: hypothetical protein M1118_14820 [Chloroflexi bacterium]|nr:hypothetical protein [Chloroflexota bacterium]
MLTLTYPNGDVLSYAHGDNGRPQSLVLNGDIVLVNQATYTQLNQLATLPLGNGLTTQYHYYALDTSPPVANEWFGRLAQIVTGSLQNEQVTSYDLVGNPTGLSYSDHTSESFAATYNEWDQLTAFGSLEGYGYIPSGQQVDIGTLQTKGSESYSYSTPGQPRPHAPTSISGVGSYGYDANGNQTSDPSVTYTYDVENHLIQLTQGGSAVLQNTFDGDGLRLVCVASGVTTHFIGDWYEFNVTSGVATAYYPFGTVPVALKQGSTLSYLHHDHLGSLVSATDGNGTELGWARYYATTTGQFQTADVVVPNFAKGGTKDPQTLDHCAWWTPRGTPPRWAGVAETSHNIPQQESLFTRSDPGEPNGSWTSQDLVSLCCSHAGVWFRSLNAPGRISFRLSSRSRALLLKPVTSPQTTCRRSSAFTPRRQPHLRGI